MIMLKWPRKNAIPLQLGALWTVMVDTNRILAMDHNGKAKSVSWENLSRVEVETTDKGRRGTDVWWLLYTLDGSQACAFPQNATGERKFLDHLIGLPVFDADEYREAMQSPGDAVYTVWQRQD